MINVYLDLKYFEKTESNIIALNFFLNNKPDNLKIIAVIDLTNYNDLFVKGLNVDDIVTVYGAAVNNADIFITWGWRSNYEYDDIIGILTKKNIFSISIRYRENMFNDFLNMKILDVSESTWTDIVGQYNIFKKTINSTKIQKKNKKKIAFISPFNLTKSAIAKYSKFTLEKLCKKAIVDVYSLENNPENSVGARNMFHINRLPYVSNTYDGVITVIGDSIFHNKMVNYHLLYGSSCIMHDSGILGFSRYLFGEQYILNIMKFYGKQNFSNIDEFQKVYENRYDSLKSKGIEPILKASKVYFTHSKTQFNTLKDSNTNMVYLPFCFHNNIKDDKLNDEYKLKIKKKLGFKENDIVVISLGIVSEHKLSLEILHAYKKLKDDKKQNYNNVKMVFVGQFNNEQIKNKFESIAGKNKNIKYFTTHVDDELYHDYIYAADIAIQLRNTSNGQVSGALSDNISAKILTLASEDLADAIESPSYIHRLKGISTSNDIAKALKTVIDSKEYKKDFSKERDKYLKIHNFDNYVNILLKNL